MHNTYNSGAQAEADRAQQRELLTALGAWDRALRRDDCGAWSISGRDGNILIWGDGKTWVVYARSKSSCQWSATKARLSFCRLTQDGDGEGCFRLHRLPTPEQAAVIRDTLGIRKRMQFDPDEVERRRSLMKRQVQGKASG